MIWRRFFFRRGKGRVNKSLDVCRDGNQLTLHYLTFDRTRISREQRMRGEKEKRIKTLDEKYVFETAEAATVATLPHPELTVAFLTECYPELVKRHAK